MQLLLVCSVWLNASVELNLHSLLSFFISLLLPTYSYTFRIRNIIYYVSHHENLFLLFIPIAVCRKGVLDFIG
jgi:hypothetical protein